MTHTPPPRRGRPPKRPEDRAPRSRGARGADIPLTDEERQERRELIARARVALHATHLTMHELADVARASGYSLPERLIRAGGGRTGLPTLRAWVAYLEGT